MGTEHATVEIDKTREHHCHRGRVIGSGIAQTFAQAGYGVRLHARNEAGLRAARDRIAKNQETMVRAGLLSRQPARDGRPFESLKPLLPWRLGEA